MTREWGARRGRGGARANAGGRRAGAGRPKTDGEGYVALNVRLGPEQIARARLLAGDLAVSVAEVYRRGLHGQVQLGRTTDLEANQRLAVLPATRRALRERAGDGDVSSLVRGILSGEFMHL